MYDLTNDLLENYFQSKEYNNYTEKNNTCEVIDKCQNDLVEKFGEAEREEINTALFAVFNTAESHGIAQGIAIGIKFILECTS